jgi:hypothetical protein
MLAHNLEKIQILSMDLRVLHIVKGLKSCCCEWLKSYKGGLVRGTPIQHQSLDLQDPRLHVAHRWFIHMYHLLFPTDKKFS